MSVVIARISNENNIPTIRQILNIFSNDISILNDEEYRDSKFSGLLKEGRKSKIVSESKVKKEFSKHGINI